MATITKRETHRTVTQASIRRSVASSTAIETGENVKDLEAILESKPGKYSHITLAK